METYQKILHQDGQNENNFTKIQLKKRNNSPIILTFSLTIILFIIFYYLTITSIKDINKNIIVQYNNGKNITNNKK